MKDSGVDWIPEIPVNWSTVPYKHVFRKMDRPVLDGDEIITCFRDGEVTLRKNRREDGFTMADQEIGYQHISKGDLVVHGMDGFAGSIGISDSDGKATPVLIVMNPIHETCVRYFMYQLRVYAQLEVFLATSSGIRVRSCALNWKKLGNLLAMVPPLDEQRRIAAYLDERCAAIEETRQTLINEIEVLQRLRKATIHKAVTKGLDEGVPMQDSGVKWIGKVPSGWNSVRLKSVYSSSRGSAVRVGPFGSTLAASDFVSEGVWVYTQRTVLDEDFSSNDTFITDEKAKAMSSFGVFPGDLLITTRGTLGHVAVVPEDAPYGVLHPCLIRFRVDTSRVCPALLKRIFNECDLVSVQLRYLSNATTIDALYSYLLKELRIPLPPLSEQQRIADYLDERCAAIDSVIDARTKQLERLDDYRKALIFAYVIGKKEVPSHE